MEEVKDINVYDAINVQLKELRETVEKKSLNSIDKEKVERLQVALDKQEKASQEVTLKVQTLENEKKDISDKYDVLEKRLSRLPSGSEEKAAATEHMKAFEKVLRYGKDAATVDEVKYLRTDSNVEGGYLAPKEYIAEIIKAITEISPIRQLARVRQTSSKSVTIPVRTSLSAAAWAGEGEGPTPSNSQYGEKEIKVNRLSGEVRITTEMLGDAAFNMESEINSDITESFAQAEGLAFVKGNGIIKPEGFMTNSSVPSINSGIADKITADNLIELAGELKTGYQPVYGMTRKTIAAIRALKGSDGQYLWQAGNLAAGIPNAINGYSYFEIPDMDEIGAGNYPIILADFRRGYLIVDHTMMMVIRDDFTLASEGKVKFVFNKRTGGLVVQPEALIKLKVSV